MPGYNAWNLNACVYYLLIFPGYITWNISAWNLKAWVYYLEFCAEVRGKHFDAHELGKHGDGEGSDHRLVDVRILQVCKPKTCSFDFFLRLLHVIDFFID